MVVLDEIFESLVEMLKPMLAKVRLLLELAVDILVAIGIRVVILPRLEATSQLQAAI